MSIGGRLLALALGGVLPLLIVGLTVLGIVWSLGLYLARNVMERMGGRISVDSEVGRGRTFKLHLPVVE